MKYAITLICAAVCLAMGYSRTTAFIGASNQNTFNAGPLSFTSFLPAGYSITGHGAAPFSPTLNGSGFLGVTITTLKADDGSGHVYVTSNFTTQNNNAAIPVWDVGSFAFTGTYSISYSTDNGSTYASTGLTLPITP